MPPRTSLYLPERDRAIIEQAARAADESISEYMRNAALTRAGAPSVDARVDGLDARLRRIERLIEEQHP